MSSEKAKHPVPCSQAKTFTRYCEDSAIAFISQISY